MNLEHFEKHARSDYGAFAEVVGNVIASAISAQPALRLQHIQHRAKAVMSLRVKLEKMNALERDDIESVVKDLAGCRLVFYTNSDVNHFQASRMLYENFNVDWDRTKIHHPSPETRESADLFISDNYVVHLTEDRLKLPEYARFKGMVCEVQVQTTLNHAWSEMAHDTIYKKPVLDGFGTKLMKGIDKRMATIMRDYLVPAGYEFQKVKNDFDRLSSGKDLFDQGALDAISSSSDNNELHDLMQRFATYVLPNFDNLQTVHLEIRNTVVSAVKHARLRSSTPIETPFGLTAGHSTDSIVGIAADIFDELHYVDEDAVAATFDAICELYPSAPSSQQKRLIESARKLSKNQLNVWNHAGPAVQSLLVKRAQALNDASLKAIWNVALVVLGQALKPEVEGITSNYNSVTIQIGAVTPSDQLKAVRTAAIDVLKKMFLIATSDEERREVIRALSHATAPPNRGDYSNALQETIFCDAANIAAFYADQIGELSFELLQVIEHDLLWMYRRSASLPGDFATDATVVAANAALTGNILRFRAAVNDNIDFVTYKTLVGYQSVFPPDWDTKTSMPTESKGYRDAQVRVLLNSVTEESADRWLATLARCAKTESNDLATFPTFGRFLEDLALARPAIVVSYLDRLDGHLANFLPAMLVGLDRGELSSEARRKVNDWIAQKKYLKQVSWYQRHMATIDPDMLANTLSAAIGVNDVSTVQNIVACCVARYKDAPKNVVDAVFIRAVKYLEEMGNSSWVYAIWPIPDGHGLFHELERSQVSVVLNALLRVPSIDHQVEDLLEAIAVTFPDSVVDYFGHRLQLGSIEEASAKYDAIPYELHSLEAAFSNIAGYVVSKVRTWFDDDQELFSYRGGQFISIAFPVPSPGLEASLTSLLASGNEEDSKFVIDVMRGYQGKQFTHPIYKEVVKALPLESPLLNEVEIGLDQTGVVSGEFGFVHALQQKKTEAEPWISDADAKVRSFAKTRNLSLDRQIAAEQRRGEASVEMRKREYD